MSAPAEAMAEGITVRLVGGLGNQLFQYAAGRAVSERLRCPLFLDRAPLANVGAQDTPCEFALGWLVGPEQAVESVAAPGGRLVSAVRRRLPALARGRVFQQQGFAYDPRITEVGKGTILSGYFQSWRYFSNIEDTLRAELHARAPRSRWHEATAEQLDSLGSWIAVHVRRGDYLQARNTAYHGLLGRGYYERAVAALRAQGSTGRLVLFSDDPQSARDMLGELASDALVIEPSADAHAMESIELISRAPAIVTANSSFSWWGGWLADPGRSVVVCPSPWLHGAGLDEHDLRPPQWLMADAGFGAA